MTAAPPTSRAAVPALRAVAWLLLALGVAAWLVLVVMASRGDRTRATFEPPAAPGLDLSAGTHRLEMVDPGADVAAIEAHVFDLATRTPLALETAEDVLTFEVPATGIYVVDVEPRDPSVVPASPLEVRVVQTSTFRLSLRLWASLLLAPLASMPGTLALWLSRWEPGVEGVALPRRLAAVAIDAVTAVLIVAFLILISPPFRPIAGLIPLAPVAYAWSIASRGQGIGGWLLLVRTVRLDGRPPGAWRGLLRTYFAAVSWLPAGLGYAAAALDAEGRTWHDRASAARVIEA
ncbi:MAG: RDD family protein [Dehalococcoidia bacterium]